MLSSQRSLRKKALQGDRVALQQLYQCRELADYDELTDTELRQAYVNDHDVIAHIVLQKRCNHHLTTLYRSFSLRELLFLYWAGDIQACDSLVDQLQQHFYSPICFLVAARKVSPAEHAEPIFQQFCQELLLDQRAKYESVFRDVADGYVIGYLTRRSEWAVNNYFSAASPDASLLDSELITRKVDAGQSVPDDHECVRTVAALIAKESCTLRCPYILYQYGTKPADLAILWGTADAPLNNESVALIDARIHSVLTAANGRMKRLPGSETADRIRIFNYEQQALLRRRRLQNSFALIAKLLRALNAAARKKLLALIASPVIETEQIRQLRSLPVAQSGAEIIAAIDDDVFRQLIQFMAKLLTLSCSQREALLLWDYLHQDLGWIAEFTIATDRIASDNIDEAIDLVYQRWHQAAGQML